MKATEILTANLIKLRKSFHLSQVELAQKINYSDKAISRWEKGEVVPSIDVLEQLAQVYNVKITYFFEEHLDESDLRLQEKTFNLHLYVMFSLVLVVWTVAVLVFFSIKNRLDIYYFESLVWAIPLTFYVVSWCSKNYFNRRFYLLSCSFACWFTLGGIYFQLLKYNFWTVFLFGIPVQIFLVLASLLTKINGQKKKDSATAKKVENFFMKNKKSKK